MNIHRPNSTTTTIPLALSHIMKMLTFILFISILCQFDSPNWNIESNQNHSIESKVILAAHKN